MNPGQYYEA
jgi:hypothetical protein